MNKKHVSKVGKYIGMACLLFACAMVQSCRDEYYFDDTEPDFLGSSIYDYLKENDFTLFVKIIDDLKYAEVLDKTGSKTLFVADDKAFMEGIEKAWGIKDTADLTIAQKRIILNNAMLDNAYLLEMLSKMQSTGTNAEPVPGQCVRRETSMSVVDSVPLFYYKDMPGNNPDWDIFKDGNARLALDATPTLMLHFIKDYLYQETVTEGDLQKILRKDNASWEDMYFYDKKVIKEKSDVTCKNGYVHQLDGLLIPPSNMAEELRKNGESLARNNDGTINDEALDSTTLIFNRMLDRFSVPVPIDKDGSFAETYYFRFPDRVDEQLYEKKYYVQGKLASYTDINNVPHNAVGTLLFDPGWNAYNGEGLTKERDMAAIFAPSDKAFVSYFTEDGSGKELIKRYADDVEGNDDINKGLLAAIDSIPLDLLESLLNNHMQVSFVSSVPSKFRNIVNDARDALGLEWSQIKKPILANNGVIYVTDRVYKPARFVSVIAPVMLNDTLFVFNRMIEDEGYDSYLLSMQNKFSLVVTADGAMRYYDPYTERRRGARKIYQFRRVDTKDKTTGVINSSVKAKELTQAYNSSNNSYGTITEGNDIADGLLKKLYKEILEYNIVLGDMNSDDDREGNRKYYMSKGYGGVKVERDDKGFVTKIAGGRELQQNIMLPLACAPVEKENGRTFQLAGALMQPATQTVREVLMDSLFTGKCFQRFYYDLCLPDNKVLNELYRAEPDSTRPKNQDDYNKQFRIFNDANLVSVFDTYHYTVYVPTADALEKAYSQGLKTWEDLAEECEEIEELKKTEPEKAAERLKAVKADAELIAKFVRYHFQDNSVFVDNPRHSFATNMGGGKYDYDYTVEYSTAAVNNTTNRFSKVLVQTDEAENTIAVRGDFGEKDNTPLRDCENVCRVINTNPDMENKSYNVMTRDVDFMASGEIRTSSYAVVHLIDNFLVYGGEGGIYDAENKQFIKYIEK